jgi:hypothetical protein
MSKSFDFKIETVPIPEKPQERYGVELFTDKINLMKRFEGIDSENVNDIIYMKEWAKYIENKEYLPSFDTLLDTIFNSNNNLIKEYFDIHESDNEFISDLNNTNQDQHERLVILYNKIKNGLTKLILVSITDKDSRELLISLIEEYNTCLDNRVHTFIEKIPEYKKEFFDKISNHLTHLGNDYDLEKIKTIIYNTPIRFSDYLTPSNNTGFINPDHVIELRLSFGPFYGTEENIHDINSEAWDYRDSHPNLAKRTIFHELLHAITSSREKITIQKNESKKISIRSTGVNFHVNKDRFNWLNEAVTELITLDICEETRITAYLDEIRLYELILDKIPNKDTWRDLQKTYFFNAKKDGADGLAEWKENRKLIEESIGDKDRNFLVRLDNWIETNGGMPDGVIKAIEVISKWEDDKPQPEDFY